MNFNSDFDEQYSGSWPFNLKGPNLNWLLYIGTSKTGSGIRNKKYFVATRAKYEPIEIWQILLNSAVFLQKTHFLGVELLRKTNNVKKSKIKNRFLNCVQKKEVWSSFILPPVGWNLIFRIFIYNVFGRSAVISSDCSVYI